MPAFISKYKVIEKIGEGSFSEVLRCEERITKQQYAAKILKKCFENTNDVLYCAEVIAMQKLSKHQNILYMHEYFLEKTSGKLVFLFELMDMSLYEFMKSKKRCIPEPKVKNFLFQILKGLDYLHRHGLFHRDIKPENILVKFADNLSPKGELIKIADLGSIRGIYSKPPYTEYISTRWYRSPECLLTVGHYGSKMDVWATGCVFYEILTSRPLFPGKNEIDQLAKIHSILGTPSTRLLAKLKSRSKNCISFEKNHGSGLNSLVKFFSEDAQVILRLMLQYDPDIRINVRRLLQHRYFSILREEDRTKKFYTKQRSNRESGDHNHKNSDKNKFQSNSVKSFFSVDQKKSNGINATNTTIELRNRNSHLLGSYVLPRDHPLQQIDLQKHWQQVIQKYQINKTVHSGLELVSKTTSNLMQNTRGSNVFKGNKMQSKSFVAPNRINTKQKGKVIECKKKYKDVKKL